MRGKGAAGNTRAETCGITPAYAGKSEKGYDKFTEIGDHPRLCGEKLLEQEIYDTNTGSPPPMRGKD